MNAELWKRLLYLMLLIRAFEERVAKEFVRGRLAGTMFHLSIGQEAVAAGAVSVLREDDYLLSTHRGHGHFIAKGGDLRRTMAELFGKTTGYCKGKGGSMHVADIKLGHLGANGIVGGGIPLATGAALASLIKGTDQVTACFFGDGAVNEGVFHESLNLAGLWKLPVVYVCENNMYALSTRLDRVFAVVNIAERAKCYAMPGISVDGMNVLNLRSVMEKAVARARKGDGPTLIECKTYRFFGHSRKDPSPYRTTEEEEKWKAKDPLVTFRRKLLEEGIVTEQNLSQMEDEIENRLDDAVQFANESPCPDIDTLCKDIYA